MGLGAGVPRGGSTRGLLRVEVIAGLGHGRVAPRASSAMALLDALTRSSSARTLSMCDGSTRGETRPPRLYNAGRRHLSSGTVAPTFWSADVQTRRGVTGP